MANRKNCIKCGRGIDEFARVCPYCNWWQSEPLPAAAQAAPIDYKPPIDARARNSILGILAFGFLLMVAFTVGAFFHGSEPASAAQPAAQTTSAAPAPTPHATVTLIPMNDGAPLPAPGSPATSLPTQGANPNAPGTNDVTALPSEQYSAAAARANAAQGQQAGSVVDPRSIVATTDSPPPGAFRRAAAPRAQRAPIRIVQTQPVPVYQPVPRVRVFREETAQLSLIVGTDGRVHDIDIRRNVPGVMGPLIGDVQQWRFRPAMQSGQPVSSRFSVAVTFKP